MTSLPFFQVDAFAEKPLTGNPAAVMPLERWLDDAVMQAIAAENNLSETAFTVPGDRDGVDFELRWFTPAAEVEMCGHATIASGHILMTGSSVRFSTKSGIMIVSRSDGLLELDMRAAHLSEVHEPDLCEALGLPDSPVWLADGYNDAAIVEVADQAAVMTTQPDFRALKPIHRMAVVTSRGERDDVVSRVFVPYLGIDEDPVTGSAHAALVPYWTKRLGRNEFTALQASERSGVLHCRQEGDRAVLGGHCQTVIVGQFQL
jgi:PhzF family phenazine biosynthesis protein